MPIARVIDKGPVAALHALFDHAAPGDAMIHQLAVPFVVVESNFAGFQVLFGNFTFTPGLAALKFVEFTFSVGVPRIEKLARVAPLRLSIRFALSAHLFGELTCIFLIKFIGDLDLLLRIFQRNRLEQRIDAAGGHQRIRDRRFRPVEILGDDGFQLRNHLTVELTGIVKCSAEEGYLKQQFKWHERRRQVDNFRATTTQMLAN